MAVSSLQGDSPGGDGCCDLALNTLPHCSLLVAISFTEDSTLLQQAQQQGRPHSASFAQLARGAVCQHVLEGGATHYQHVLLAQRGLLHVLLHSRQLGLLAGWSASVVMQAAAPQQREDAVGELQAAQVSCKQLLSACHRPLP
jgi:hypothetical protein